jgi:hypothetical protein
MLPRGMLSRGSGRLHVLRMDPGAPHSGEIQVEAFRVGGVHCMRDELHV